MLLANPILQSMGNKKPKHVEEIELGEIDKKDIPHDDYVNVGNDEFKDLARGGGLL